MSIEEIVTEAMKLDSTQRHLLAHRLLATLDSDLDFQADSAREADRRARDLRDGTLQPVSGDEMVQEALERLK